MAAAVEASVCGDGEGGGGGETSAVGLKGGAVSKSGASLEAGARPSSPAGLLIMVRLLHTATS